jgi:hypothetical protein
MTIQNNNYDVDYSQFYLDAKKAFEAIPEAVNNKNYAEAGTMCFGCNGRNKIGLAQPSTATRKKRSVMGK